MWLIKHWKPALSAVLLLALFGAWQYDRARRYTRGQADKAAEISLALAKAAKKQAEQARQASADYQAEKAERENKRKDTLCASAENHRTPCLPQRLH